MDLTLHLNDDGAFKDRAMANGFSLDALCDMFAATPHDRHTAGGDAFITVGRRTLGEISKAYAVER